MKKIYIFLFVFILVIGLIFRFYKLGEVPDSLNWDEVSWGYNAYSILETGKDEYGVAFPLSFQAFGDFKQPVYVYLTSLSIKFFGLNAFAVRLPSALLGSLTMPFVFLLVYSMFYKENYRKKLSLLAMFFFAISPWSIQFSRVAYEANVGLFFVVTGASLFIFGLASGRKKYLYTSVIPLIISGYSYHSEKIFTPIFIVGLLFYAHSFFKTSKKTLFIIFILFLLGSMGWIVDTRTTARGRSVTFFSNQNQVLKDSVEKLSTDRLNNDKLGLLLDNRRVAYVNKYFENYLSHFDLNYLFVKGDDAKHHAFGMGMLYLISLPIIIAGLIKIDKKKYFFLFFWFFLAPVASSLAIDAPNSSRDLIILPTWQIFEALGFYYLLSGNNNFKWRMLKAAIIFLFGINIAYYSFNYFSHTNSELSLYWQHGYSDAAEIAQTLRETGVRVFFSQKYEQPYIFYLFYNQYNPQKYISSGGSSRIKQNCFAIDNVYFGECNSKITRNDLLISINKSEGSGLTKVKDIKDNRGVIVGEVYKY
jgi:4-amino-4-deoxy-L-arabinose transferase-like glycosyltransferase